MTAAVRSTRSPTRACGDASAAITTLVEWIAPASWSCSLLSTPIAWRAAASAGLERRRIELMSSPRPAPAAPSSFTSSVSRSAVGTFQMSNRSLSVTGALVCDTGTVGALSPCATRAGEFGVPGRGSKRDMPWPRITPSPSTVT